MAITKTANKVAKSWRAQSPETRVAINWAKSAIGNTGRTNLLGRRCSLRSITVSGHATASKYRAGIRAMVSDKLGTALS